MSKVEEDLRELSTAPVQKDAFDVWLAQEDALRFLNDNAEEEGFVVYASLTHHSCGLRPRGISRSARH